MNIKKQFYGRFVTVLALAGVSVTGLSVASVQAEQQCKSETIKATAGTARYEATKEGVVLDTLTGLEWRQCVEGVSGEACDQGEASLLNWAHALTHVAKVNAAKAAGHDDWRLPNVRELNSIVELQCADPAINSEIFPAAPSVHTWTSSPYHFYTHYSWFVDFASGAVTYDERIQPKAVRLVRSAR